MIPKHAPESVEWRWQHEADVDHADSRVQCDGKKERLKGDPSDQLAGDADQATVILVHGTFAGDRNDTGKKWWQHNSRAANQLQSRLPRGVSIARDGEVFHWSGENSERARSKAASQLFQKLRDYEEAGRDYHLVGHSHGGSVIWNMLRLAKYSGKHLTHLRSWTTVGTPYLQHRGRSIWDLTNLISMSIGILLLPMAFRAMRMLCKMVVNALSGSKVQLVLQSDFEVGYTALIRSPILSALEYIGVAVDRSGAGIRIGNYDPLSEETLFNYFFFTSEGLLLLCVTLIVMYFFLHLSLMCIRPAVESFRIRAEERLRLRTFEEYGPRSLAIWSPDDEAINGLRSTLNISVKFVGKMLPQERVYLSDAIGLVSRPYYWLFAPLYNRWGQPWLDRVVRRIVIRSAQGNDRPTATIVDVTSSPVQEAQKGFPPIPARLNSRLVSVADHHARDLVPLLRRLMGNASFSNGLEAFCNDLSGRELVHTSYFDHAEILDLISCNITLETNVAHMQYQLGRMSPDLVEWFAQTKRELQHQSNVEIVASRRKPLRRAG